jgi:hypothetical protein
VALLAAGLSLLLAGLGARGLVCGPSWSKVPSAQQLGNPQAIAAISNDDIWVVGGRWVNGRIASGAQHWDGSEWSLFPTPNVEAEDNMLNGVDALTSKDVWAVGYSMVDERYKTLVEHWNGARWRVVPSPNVSTAQYNVLTSVDALDRNSVWAVGSYLKGNSRKTLIQRWNGTSWKIVSSPNADARSNSLLGVTAVGPRNIWAVGWKSSPKGLRSLVLHRDGTQWKKVAVPAVATGDNVLTDISAVNGKDVWATGYYVDGATYKTLTLHYNGTSWKHVPSPNGEDGISILRGVGTFSSSNAWAVGFEYRADLHHYVASTQHWDGSTWTAFPSAISGYGRRDNEMSSVAKAPRTSQVWAAGRPGNVETVCPRENLTETAPVQEVTGKPPDSSGQASKQPSPALAESSVPSAPVDSTTGGIPVKAVNKAVGAGISEKTKTYGAIITDFNNDRKADIFLGRHGGVARLYINDSNGHFTEVEQGTFVRTDRHGCDAADVNTDELKDIFCSTGARRGTTSKRNELYIQRPDHTFAEQAARYGVLDPFGRGRLSAFIDANGDARADLFVGNQATRGDAMPSPNRLFINRRAGKYRHAPGYGLAREMSAKTYGSNVSVGDLDRDGWKDLVLPTSSGLHVYRNKQGRGFTNVAASIGLGQTPKAVTLAWVNGDRWLDVIEVSSNKLRVMLNDGGTFRRAFSTTLQNGHSVAAGDVNRDRRPDIYVMRGNHKGVNAPDQLYLNDGTGKNFTRKSSIPSTDRGKAESVWPIDYDGNGQTDFLALNGSGQAEGPVQLIAFFPAS